MVPADSFGLVQKSLHSTAHKALLETLYQSRLQAGFTQTQLATCLGVPQSFVSKYENGERRLDLIELQAVCTCLALNLTDFICAYQQRLHEAKP
jgi:transcriptional regulator with XRE-family HTH domain